MQDRSRPQIPDANSRNLIPLAILVGIGATAYGVRVLFPATATVRRALFDEPHTVRLKNCTLRRYGGADDGAISCAKTCSTTVEWGAIASMSGRPVDDLFDLSFLMFQGFWVRGWSVGVLLLGAMTILIAFYSELARIEAGRLVHIAKLGPLNSRRLTSSRKSATCASSSRADIAPKTVRLRFDYDEWQNGGLVPLIGVLFFGCDSRPNHGPLLGGKRHHRGLHRREDPYTRIMVMHLTLIFGGWIILLIGMPMGALVVLLVLKTAADLHAHRDEHGVEAKP